MEANNSLMVFLLLAFVTVGNACNYEVHICVDVSWSVCEVECEGASLGICPKHCHANFRKEIHFAAQVFAAINSVRDILTADFLLRIAAYSTTASELPTFSGQDGKDGIHVAQSILDLEDAFDENGITDVSFGGTNVHTCLEVLEPHITNSDIEYFVLVVTDGQIIEHSSIPGEAKARIQGHLSGYTVGTAIVVGNSAEGQSESVEVFGADNTYFASTWDDLSDLVISLTPSLCPYCGDGVTDNKTNETCDDGNRNDLDSCSNLCQIQNATDATVSALIQEPEEADDNDLLWLLLLLLLIPCCCLIFCLAARKKGEVAAEMDPEFVGDWDNTVADCAVTSPVMAINADCPADEEQPTYV